MQQNKAMQEKTNKRLTFLLLVLTTVTVTSIFFLRQDSVTQVDKEIFRIPEIANVDRVVLEGKVSVELKYNGSKWKVNDRYDADDAMIQVLFATLEQAEPRRPVSPSLRDAISNVLDESGVTVSAFAGNTLQKKFRVGGNDKKTQSFFASSPEEIYLMTIPGYRVYVAGIFELGEQGWRDKRVLSFHWRNFKSLAMSYPKRPVQNFTVALKDNMFGVQGLPKTDTVKLAGFMDHLFGLKVDEYLNDTKIADSLKGVGPEATLEVTDIAENHHQINIYPSENERVMVMMPNNQVAVIGLRQIRPLLQSRAFFIPR